MSKARLAPELFLNRELGQLAFNRRVLAQAEDPATPLLERLRFLCIVSSNLDEFFEVRIAGKAVNAEKTLVVVAEAQDSAKSNPDTSQSFGDNARQALAQQQ